MAQQLPLECGYCLVDEGYRICVWTFGAGAITGVSAAEAINRDLADLVPAGPRDALLAGVDRVINGARDRVLVDCDAWLPGLQVRLSASIGGLGGRQCLLRMERADPGPGSGGLLPDTPTLVIGRDGRVHDANSAAKRLCSAAGVALVEDLLPPGLASRAWEGLAHSDRLNAHWKVGDVAIDWSLNYISDADEIHAWGIVRNNLENYRRILENSVDGIFQTSRTGRILYVNAELATLFGYASPEKMSAEIRNLQRDLYSDAEERQRFIDILDRDGEVRGFETRMRRRDGTAVWVQLNARAVADNAGVPQFYVGTVYDISTLKALESEARERQERYRSLVHAAGTAICFVDADGIIREWNPTAADLTGFSWTEAIGRHFATMLSGDATHRTELAERVHAWMTEGSATDEELIIRHRDGGHRLLQWNARAHLDQGGGLQGVICVGQDMTERKAVEMALRRAEKNYRGIFENATDGIYQTDANGRLLSANPALAAIFGYSSAAEMVGEGLDLSHLIPDAHALEGVMTQLSEQRAVHGLEQRIRLHDGSFAWISLSARTVADGDSPRIEGVVVDITERHKAAERLDFIAHHDGLTRLANRHAFQEALARMVEEVTGGTRSGFALLLIDLDNFKDINDTLGHRVGDGLLESVAHDLDQWVRHDDVLARLGGDEFALILPEPQGQEEVEQACTELLAMLGSSREVDGRDITATASIGITLFPQDAPALTEGEPHGLLLQNVELALYWSKGVGGNRYHFFAPEMQAELNARKKLEDELARAIASDELVLHFQPVVDLDSQETTGVEALIRWNHPERGIVSPVEFIPTAERTGMIHSIGLWVVENACRTVSEWSRDDSLPPLVVAINLSAQELMDDDVLDQVERALATSGLPPERLHIEITESTMISSPERVRHLLSRFRELGVRVAIDDFGTGYSSLAYLKDLPVDILKIDRSFVSASDEAERNAAILRAIVELGHSLDLKVTAEGIESETQLERLRDHGVEQAQGFLLGRPMPAEDFLAWLRARS